MSALAESELTGVEAADIDPKETAEEEAEAKFLLFDFLLAVVICC